MRQTKMHYLLNMSSYKYAICGGVCGYIKLVEMHTTPTRNHLLLRITFWIEPSFSVRLPVLCLCVQSTGCSFCKILIILMIFRPKDERYFFNVFYKLIKELRNHFGVIKEITCTTSKIKVQHKVWFTQQAF